MNPETTKSVAQVQKQGHSDIQDAVAEDRRLRPEEKETVLRFVKAEDRVWVYTEEGGLMRRLLSHPKFRLKSLRVITEDSWGEQVDADDLYEGSITGVDGWLPISVVSLKTTSRTTSQHAAIVPDRVLREA